MANPIIPGIPQTEQDLLYSKLNAYNQGRASYKEVGAYLIVLPRPEYLQYTLWIYSPLPGRQSASWPLTQSVTCEVAEPM